MSETIEHVHELLTSRVREINKEVASLEKALKSLGTSSRSTQRRKTRRGSSVRRGPRRAKRGLRREQFLAELKKNPGAKASSVAATIGVSSSQGYGLARQLERSGEIQRSGNGLRIAAKARK